MTRGAGRSPRIAIAGIAIESSAYSPYRAGHDDFAILEGAALVDRYAFLRPGTSLGDAADWRGVLTARAIPGGRVRADVYADLRERIVAGLGALVRDGGLDGVLLDIHGAMSVDGMDDAEGDLLVAIRGAIGRSPIVAAAMDLHGNLSRRFLETCDLPTCFRLAPHEDAEETRERAARTLVEQIDRGGRPVRAWVPVPVLLPGERTSTRVEPARSLYGRIPEIERRDGVLDASIWIGYAWADEPRCRAGVVVTGSSEAAVRDGAEELASSLWAVRSDFAFVGPPGSLAEAVDRALAATDRPYFISDSGDNPGAGGTGDVTWTLARLLADPRLTAPDAPVVLCASVFDAAAVGLLHGHRVGDDVRVTVGARVDHRVHGPVELAGVLHALDEDDPVAGRSAVVRVGGLHVVVTERRKAFHDVASFERLGLDPAAADVVVTKIGYLEPTLHEIARGWTLALTPGPVDQHLDRLGHERIRRPMFPFDPMTEEPDLAAVVLR